MQKNGKITSHSCASTCVTGGLGSCDTPGCTRKTAALLITRAPKQPAPCTQPVKRFYRLNARCGLAEGYIGPVVIKAVAACQIYPYYLLGFEAHICISVEPKSGDLGTKVGSFKKIKLETLSLEFLGFLARLWFLRPPRPSKPFRMV